MRIVLVVFVRVAVWGIPVLVAGAALWFQISYRLERRRSIARIQDCIARAPGIPEEDRARLIAEVPERFKEAEARQRREDKRRKARQPSDAEIWKDAWETQMRSFGNDKLVDELSGQWSTEEELEVLLRERHSASACTTSTADNL